MSNLFIKLRNLRQTKSNFFDSDTCADWSSIPSKTSVNVCSSVLLIFPCSLSSIGTI
eukprot:10577.XXX_373293_373460_1 [CDS] Oithona nana genome sequencing.